jgi:hypothetical protein
MKETLKPLKIHAVEAPLNVHHLAFKTSATAGGLSC